LHIASDVSPLLDVNAVVANAQQHAAAILNVLDSCDIKLLMRAFSIFMSDLGLVTEYSSII